MTKPTVALVIHQNSTKIVVTLEKLKQNLTENYFYRWFSRYIIAAMLVDRQQKIAH